MRLLRGVTSFSLILLTTQALASRALVIGVSSLPKSLDPQDAWHYLHFTISESVMQTLVRSDAGGKISAGLAKRWEIDRSQTAYTFRLDERATFHDGTPVQCSDVAYSLGRILRTDLPHAGPPGGRVQKVGAGCTNASCEGI